MHSGHDKLAGGVPLWRWRFLYSPYLTKSESVEGVRHRSVEEIHWRIPCVAALTDEFGSDVPAVTAAQVLGNGKLLPIATQTLCRNSVFMLRCEVLARVAKVESSSEAGHQWHFVCGQRVRVIPEEALSVSKESVEPVTTNSAAMRWRFRPRVTAQQLKDIFLADRGTSNIVQKATESEKEEEKEVFRVEMSVRLCAEWRGDDSNKTNDGCRLGSAAAGVHYCDPFLVVPVISAPISISLGKEGNIIDTSLRGRINAVGTFCERAFSFSEEPSGVTCDDPPAVTKLNKDLAPPFPPSSHGNSSKPGSDGNNVGDIDVLLREESGERLGSHVWNSGIVLAKFLATSTLSPLQHVNYFTSSNATSISSSDTGASLHSKKHDFKVLELGSGCGVTGIVASKLLQCLRTKLEKQKRNICSTVAVHMTDLPSMLSLLRSNISRNGIALNVDDPNDRKCKTFHGDLEKVSTKSDCDFKVKVSSLDWELPTEKDASVMETTEEKDDGGAMEKADIILAADILYSPALFPGLLNLFATRIRLPLFPDSPTNNSFTGINSGGVVLVAFSHRNNKNAGAISLGNIENADTPGTHPFFVHAASRQQYECLRPETSKLKDSGENCWALRWHCRTVHFCANVEIIEMRPAWVEMLST